MDNSNKVDTVFPSNNESLNEPTIVRTDVGSKNGQSKCPKCVATDISLNKKSGKLRCNFCRYEFNEKELEGLEKDISKLSGKVIASGASKIDKDFNSVMTFKCSSCGAEVVIDTNDKTQARCHWCRNFLSINMQIPNGSVPDAILPFKITKEDARSEIENFVGKRKFYANPKFKKEFTTENIMGVYFPYMVVDINSKCHFSGNGEHLVRKYIRRNNDDSTTTYYDADLYHIERDFDIVINGLTVESNTDRIDNSRNDQTNNIINSIMPFDIENCCKYDSNYLRGYTSEKRNIDVDKLHSLVELEGKDIAKFSINDTLKYYDRGVKWDNETFTIKGEQWKSAYLPVWLYSYQEVSNNKKILHYVAVNARTKETMGSVPIHMPKLLFVSFLVEILGFFGFISFDDFDFKYIFLATGIVYYLIIHARYRNGSARHKYETETNNEVSNVNEVDNLIEKRTGLTNSMIRGANNKSVSNNRNAISSIFNNDNDD